MLRGDAQEACLTWLRENVEPLLVRSPRDVKSFLGEDFGRSGDLSVLWPLLVDATMKRRTPFVIEMRNVPFSQQEQLIFWLIDRAPAFSGGAFDARGNGQQIAEAARQRYGAETIAEVKLSEGWYRENMPPLKSELEDGMMDLPKDGDVIDDFRSLVVVNGVARVPEASTKGTTGQRHGDSVIAGALALFASRTLDGGSFEFSVDGERVMASDAFAGELGRSSRNYSGWND
jgi:phage FluMu gp28-like protein